MMSTADLLGTADPVGEKPDLEKKLFRIAALGAVGALVAWVGQPIMVALAARREGSGGGFAELTGRGPPRRVLRGEAGTGVTDGPVGDRG